MVSSNKMQVLLLVVSLGLCYSSKLQLEEEWFSWKRQHYKTYHTEEEETSRWKVWKDNYRKIQEHNRANHSFTLGLNEFADMTKEEFGQFYLSTARDASEFLRSGIVHQPDTEDNGEGASAASSIDWRNKGYVTSVKNQGQCGSCWAFSSTGALEGQMFRSKGKLISLSEQQLVDCSWDYGNAGCNGGLMDYAFKYVKQYGLCSSSDYPYIGYMWRCRYKNCDSVASCSGYTDIKSGSEDNLLSAISKYGPVSVAIDASSSEFQLYSSGVYYDQSCSSSKLNHGVLVVGYGYNENYGYKYWIVKNSWGTSWGNEGYINMARGESNMCGIASAASFPSV